MSSDSEAPEEVSLTEGKINYRVAKKNESIQTGLNASLRKKKTKKNKKRKDEAKVESPQDDKTVEAKRAKTSLKESDQTELELLPDEVLEVVLGRVGQQEVQDKEPELEHGHTIAVGKAKKRMEIVKGPVSVKVLQANEPSLISVEASSFYSRVLGRHRRTTSMLRN